MTNLVPGTKLYIYDKSGAWHQICHLVFPLSFLFLDLPKVAHVLYNLKDYKLGKRRRCRGQIDEK